MIPADPLPNELERYADLLKYDILDTEPEADFDDIVRLASLLCDAEISLISLLDNQRQWFKAKIGLDATETSIDIAFCSHAIHQDHVFEVSDASQDERFYDNPLVTGYPHIRFYAGQPLSSAQGYKLGTLCIIDRKPRQLGDQERYILKVLAKQVEKQLELRLKVKQMEESLAIIEEQKSDLQAVNLLQSQVLSVLSHDLRTPLASLEGVLDLFDNDLVGTQDLGELIQEIRPNLSQSMQQLEDVLNWVREQIQGQKTNSQSFNMDSVADKSLSWVRENAQKKGVSLIKEIDPTLAVYGDPDLVEIVLRNLLSNAVKFTNRGDSVTLFAEPITEQVYIGVRDTGVGITKENIERMLYGKGKFSSLGTAREKGTGLGLVLCQTYLTKMNTHLQVMSVPNHGCNFYFLLPTG
jgi:signal transduction histidine kinase